MTDPGSDRFEIFQRGGHLFMVVAAVFTGLAGALGAVVFRLMIRGVQAAAWGGAEGVSAMLETGLLAEPEDPMKAARQLAWGWKIAVPALGGLLVGPLIYFFAREARGTGCPRS